MDSKRKKSQGKEDKYLTRKRTRKGKTSIDDKETSMTSKASHSSRNSYLFDIDNFVVSSNSVVKNLDHEKSNIEVPKFKELGVSYYKHINIKKSKKREVHPKDVSFSFFKYC